MRGATVGAVTAAGRWFVGPHAVQRYRERIDPRLSYEQALAAVIRDSATAHRLRELPATDELGAAELWRGPKPRRVRYVIGAGAGTLPSVVTVLAPYDGWRPRV